MRKTKTLNAHLAADKCRCGCAAAIAANDPAVYPQDGLGVELSTYSSDTGDMLDIAASLLDTFVKRAAEDGVSSVLVFSDIALYQGAVTRETVGGCTVDFVWIPAGDGQPGTPSDPREIRKKMAREALAQQLEKLEEDAGKIVFDAPPLVPGQYVLYRNGESYQIGRVKRAVDGAAFVWYSSGETASRTPLENLRVLDNAHDIMATDLGGADALAMFPAHGKGGRA